ncbi:MAG: hypothetical protein KAT05_16600 [Spirochaetes bacterium]|nr:hypothetical protein [Spirochaetota bacterium]
MNTMIPEIDKAQNINALIDGKQIMLCKKRTIVKDDELIYFWPSNQLCHTVMRTLNNPRSSNIEECIYDDKIYNKHLECKNDPSIFLLSKEGAEYIYKNKIHYLYYRMDEKKKMKHFAKIEYHDINPYSANGTPNMELFEQLKKEGLFWLWDIDEGPLKLFTTRDGDTRRLNTTGKIAIYRVYRCAKNDVKITPEDIQGHGYASRLKKESHDKIMKSIDDYGLKPVLDDDKFNKLRGKLIEIIERFGKF